MRDLNPRPPLSAQGDSPQIPEGGLSPGMRRGHSLIRQSNGIRFLTIGIEQRILAVFVGGTFIAAPSRRRSSVTRNAHAPHRPDSSSRQESLVAAMMEPAFYPKLPSEVTRHETHISYLFFAGDLVFKVKKAVRYSFLDFSTLAARRYYLQEELRLNRRLAPSVYLGVMPISCDETGWRLGGWGEPREYTLVMRRLPDRRMLPFLLGTGQVTAPMMRELAELLAAFHRAAERADGIDPCQYLAYLGRQWAENCAEVGKWLTGDADRAELERIEAGGAEFLDRHKAVFTRRAAEGWIRDVHGDLHAEHICFAPEGIQVFDCIEFSAALRRCDLALEVAFLTMDLTVRGGGSLREPFVARYAELTKDPDLGVLLPFFECHRALVRAKVHALRERAWSEAAARYFDFARRCAWLPVKPFVVMISGFSASGKSTLATALAERLGVIAVNSDVVRKKLAGQSRRVAERLYGGIYSASMTERTYSALAREAAKRVRLGEGVLLDATFGLRAQREKVARMAVKHGVPLLMIHCSATEASTRRRLRERAAAGESASDAGWEVYLAQKKAYEPMDEFTPDRCLKLDTEAPLGELLIQCEAFLRSKLISREAHRRRRSEIER